jgi:hypothetical protein
MPSDSTRKRRVAGQSSAGVSEDWFLANVRKFPFLEFSPNTVFVQSQSGLALNFSAGPTKNKTNKKRRV